MAPTLFIRVTQCCNGIFGIHPYSKDKSSHTAKAPRHVSFLLFDVQLRALRFIENPRIQSFDFSLRIRAAIIELKYYSCQEPLFPGLLIVYLFLEIYGLFFMWLHFGD